MTGNKRYRKPSKSRRHRRGGAHVKRGRPCMHLVDGEPQELKTGVRMSDRAFAKLAILGEGPVVSRAPFRAEQLGSGLFTVDAAGRWWLGAPRAGNEVLPRRLRKKLRKPENRYRALVRGRAREHAAIRLSVGRAA